MRLKSCIVVHALWTVFAIFRTPACFNEQQRCDLHFAGIKVLPVNDLGLMNQIIKRKFEKVQYLSGLPIIFCFVSSVLLASKVTK